MSKARQIIAETADIKDLIMQQPELQTYEVVFGVPGDEMTRLVRAPVGLTDRMVRAALEIEERLANIQVNPMHQEYIVEMYRLPSAERVQEYETELVDGGIIEPGQ